MKLKFKRQPTIEKDDEPIPPLYTIYTNEEIKAFGYDPNTIETYRGLEQLNAHISEGDKKMETNGTGKEETKTIDTEALDLGVGTIETESLTAAEVEVLSVKVEEQKNKKQERVGDKVILTCKHPSKDEPINISSVKYEKKNVLKESGIWFNKDKDGLIQKGSALALMMEKLEAKTINDFKGMKLQTAQDEKGYLCIKAY